MTNQTIEAVHAAYFESEACRYVAAGDAGYDLAMNLISDDGGAAWRAWLAGADQMVRTAVTEAYKKRNATVVNDRPAKARAAYSAALADGASRNAAAKAARKIWGDFKPGQA
jgi:hypothetical protein